MIVPQSKLEGFKESIKLQEGKGGGNLLKFVFFVGVLNRGKMILGDALWI